MNLGVGTVQPYAGTESLVLSEPRGCRQWEEHKESGRGNRTHGQRRGRLRGGCLWSWPSERGLKGFPDAECCRRKGVYEEQRAEIMWAL